MKIKADMSMVVIWDLIPLLFHRITPQPPIETWNFKSISWSVGIGFTHTHTLTNTHTHTLSDKCILWNSCKTLTNTFRHTFFTMLTHILFLISVCYEIPVRHTHKHIQTHILYHAHTHTLSDKCKLWNSPLTLFE